MHVRWPVSRDRRILVMEVVVGKAVYLACNIFTTDIFVLQIAYCTFVVWDFSLTALSL